MLFFHTQPCGCMGYVRDLPVPGEEYKIACPFRYRTRAFICGAPTALQCPNGVQIWECTTPTVSKAFIVAVTGGAMEPGPAHTFDTFRLEPPPGGLWRGDVRLALRPRSLAVLRYLVAHAGRLVTKAELRQHVWGGTHVSDTVLRVCVQEIRAALGDTAVAPQ